MTARSDKLWRVVKCESNTFTCVCGEKRISATARKKFKQGGIVVGDFARVEESDGGCVITEIKERKNFLIRPLAANIDTLVIVVAPEPKIDFKLVDKLIINAVRQGLETVLCLNKTDIGTEISEELHAQYDGIVDKMVEVSAKDNDISPLKNALEGKLGCFAGQSAVGKSSLCNALTGNSERAVGDLSEKNLRGKNTTTKAEILTLAENAYIIDTPGFSMLDIHDINDKELCLYYPEYVEVADKCRYRGCTHTLEPGCEVARRVESGELNMQRFMRYVELCAELEENGKRRKRR